MSEVNDFIVLLLLQNERFRISHSLIRVLERKFEIIETRPLLQDLEKRGLIISHRQGPFNYYETTLEGKASLGNNWKDGVRKLYETYPEELEFIDALLVNKHSDPMS